jgi:hypothetical protein
MQSCLHILRNNSTKESSVYKLVWDLHYITFTGFLFKYGRNTACRIHGKAEEWESTGVLSEKEPTLNPVESRKS